MERSESIVKLAGALLAAQGEMSHPKFNATNPFFKDKPYADLLSVIDTIKPVLVRHGILPIQMLGGAGDAATVTTMLIHAASGEFISETLTLKPTKTDPQTMGGAFTYGRRYGLSSMLMVFSEADDGGHNASRQLPTPQAKNRDTPESGKPAPPTAARKAFAEALAKWTGFPAKSSDLASAANQVAKACGVEKPADNYAECLAFVEAIKSMDYLKWSAGQGAKQ